LRAASAWEPRLSDARLVKHQLAVRAQHAVQLAQELGAAARQGGHRQRFLSTEAGE